MGTADEAWEKWHTEWRKGATYSPTGYQREAFLAGYRAALTEAADEYERDGIIPGYPDRHFVGGWLRARAVAVKDGSEG